MKAFTALAMFLAISAAAPAFADATQSCAVPAYLIATEAPLPATSAAIKAKQPVNILVIGSTSSGLSGPDGVRMSYPARLEVALRERFPGAVVNVSTDLRPKKTAAEIAETLEKDLEKLGDRKPTLTVWQTGTSDAIRAIDPDDFRGALNDGVTALQKAGSDVVLMNLQYNPRMETMIAVSPFNDAMRVVAQDMNIPLFDRFAIMRQWSDEGNFDLFGNSSGFQMAQRVHDCIGRALAAEIGEAAKAGAPEVQR